MKNRILVSALIAATLGAATGVAQAQSGDWQQREAQRRWRVEQQRQEEQQRAEWQQRRLGAGAYLPPRSLRGLETIDRRTQSLPPAPPGHEWQMSPSGEHLLTKDGVVVQVVRDVTPAPPVAQ